MRETVPSIAPRPSGIPPRRRSVHRRGRFVVARCLTTLRHTHSSRPADCRCPWRATVGSFHRYRGQERTPPTVAARVADARPQPGPDRDSVWIPPVTRLRCGLCHRSPARSDRVSCTRSAHGYGLGDTPSDGDCLFAPAPVGVPPRAVWSPFELLWPQKARTLPVSCEAVRLGVVRRIGR